MLNIENITERFSEFIDDDNISQLSEELNSYHSADLAEILSAMSYDNRLTCFKLIDEDKAAEMLEYSTPQIQVELLGDIDEELASRIIQKMPHDSVADVLGDMDDDESEVYLNKLPEIVSEEIRELLSYKEDTAGGVMNSTMLTVHKDMTIQEALAYLRIKAEKHNLDLYYLYVTDKQEHLLGVVSLRKLLTSSPTTLISDIMMRDIVKLHVDDSQDMVAEIFMKYQYNALPVVDLYNRLKGMVTWDDAQDIIEEETTEEILTSSGISTNLVDEDEILLGSTMKAIKARTPWLFITLIGEFFAVNVADMFQNTLTVMPIIAIFMPLLAGLGGNIGTQSITLIVRGLSTGQITLNTAINQIWRELRVGLVIGIFFGVMVSLATWKWQHNFELGLVVGAAMCINMAMATLIGAVTPVLLKKMKIDPAVASGPVIATTIDVIGLFIYFSLVTMFLVKII